MDIYKLAVDVNGREIIAHAKEGVVGSIEAGILESGREIPKHRVDVILGRSARGAAAWVQVSRTDDDGGYSVVTQGWVREGENLPESTGPLEPLRASIARVHQVDTRILKCQEDAEFGTTKCCTAKGDGCYIKCCAVCCSDPVACPGATCCP